jgi:monoterpene epsilon-lactone hydrolase
MKAPPLALALLTVHLSAQNLPPRQVPARTIPVPQHVSPEMQKLIARPIEIDSTVPRSPEEWKTYFTSENEKAAKHASDLAGHLHVRLESGTIAGVHVFHVKPELVSERNKARLMMHVHGGAYVFLGGMTK